jgi:hypothetical protein
MSAGGASYAMLGRTPSAPGGAIGRTRPVVLFAAGALVAVLVVASTFSSSGSSVLLAAAPLASLPFDSSMSQQQQGQQPHAGRAPQATGGAAAGGAPAAPGAGAPAAGAPAAGVLAAPPPGGVARAIVPDVLAALAGDLKARRVPAATAIDCDERLLAPLKASVKLTCLPPALEGGAFERARRAAAAGGGAAPGAAVLRTTRPGAAPALAARMQAAQLLAGAGGGPGVYAEVALNASGVPVRAALLDVRSGERRLWVANSREHLDTFNAIYANKVWGEDGGGSGLGSTLDYTGEGRLWGVAGGEVGAAGGGGCARHQAQPAPRCFAAAAGLGERRRRGRSVCSFTARACRATPLALPTMPC